MTIEQKINNSNELLLSAINDLLINNITECYTVTSKSHKYDCIKARRYYESLGFNCKGYEMHHTLTGLVVPVLKELHKHLPHVGWCMYNTEIVS